METWRKSSGTDRDGLGAKIAGANSIPEVPSKSSWINSNCN
jgi:hypothetical protein